MIPGRREVVLEGKLRPVTEKHHLKDGEMEPGIDLTPLSIVGWETEAAACTNAPTPTLSTQPQTFHTLHSSAVPRMHPPSNFLPQILLYCVQPVPLQCQCAGPTDPTGDIWACLQVLPLLNIPRAPVGRQEVPSPKRPARTILQGSHSTRLPQPSLRNVSISHPPGQGHCSQPSRWVTAEGPHGEQGLVWAPASCYSSATSQALSPILTAQPVLAEAWPYHTLPTTQTSPCP